MEKFSIRIWQHKFKILDFLKKDHLGVQMTIAVIGLMNIKLQEMTTETMKEEVIVTEETKDALFQKKMKNMAVEMEKVMTEIEESENNLAEVNLKIV